MQGTDSTAKVSIFAKTFTVVTFCIKSVKISSHTGRDFPQKGFSNATVPVFLAVIFLKLLLNAPAELIPTSSFNNSQPGR